jgi:hypothetical protein
MHGQIGSLGQVQLLVFSRIGIVTVFIEPHFEYFNTLFRQVTAPLTTIDKIFQVCVLLCVVVLVVIVVLAFMANILTVLIAIRVAIVFGNVLVVRVFGKILVDVVILVAVDCARTLLAAFQSDACDLRHER